MRIETAIGTVYVFLGQASFLLSGMIVQFGLGRILGPGDYGLFSVTISMMTNCYTLITSGIPLAASREIAANEACSGIIAGQSRRVLTKSAVFVTTIYLALSYPIGFLLGDTSLVPLIQISAFVVPVYGFYALYTSFHNGAMDFRHQSSAMLALSITKVASVFVLVSLGLAVGGAILGYLLGALAGFIVAFRFWNPRKPLFDCNVNTTREVLRFSIPVIAYAVCFNILMSVDLFIVKAIVQDPSESGFYAAALTIAKLPFLILSALSFVVFPAVSKSLGQGNGRLAGAQVSEALKYLLMILLPMIGVLLFSGKDIVILLYTPQYSLAALPLSLLAVSYGSLSVFSMLIGVIQAAGSSREGLLLTVPLVPLSMVLTYYMTISLGMIGAAAGTFIASTIGAAATLIYARHRLGGTMSAGSCLRVILSFTASFVCAAFLGLGIEWSSVIVFVFLVLYVLILVSLRLLRVQHLRILVSVIRSRSKGDDISSNGLHRSSSG